MGTISYPWPSTGIASVRNTGPVPSWFLRSQHLLRPRESQRSSGGANPDLPQIRETFSTLLGKIQELLNIAPARFLRTRAGKLGANFGAGNWGMFLARGTRLFRNSLTRS